MSDSTETPGLAAVREALAAYDAIPDDATDDAELDAFGDAIIAFQDAVCGLLAHTRRERDEAREAHVQAVKDNVSLRVSVDVLDGTVAGLKVQRDEARDELQRLWDATEADRARMAELESRPTYADGLREALYAVSGHRLHGIACYKPASRAEAAILALLEPKP